MHTPQLQGEVADRRVSYIKVWLHSVLRLDLELSGDDAAKLCMRQGCDCIACLGSRHQKAFLARIEDDAVPSFSGWGATCALKQRGGAGVRVTNVLVGLPPEFRRRLGAFAVPFRLFGALIDYRALHTSVGLRHRVVRLAPVWRVGFFSRL